MQKKLVENVIYLTDLIAQKIYCFWSILGSRKLEMNAMYLRSEFVRNILNILIHFPSFFGPERWKHVSIHFRNIFGQVKYGLPAVKVKARVPFTCNPNSEYFTKAARVTALHATGSYTTDWSVYERYPDFKFAKGNSGCDLSVPDEPPHDIVE